MEWRQRILCIRAHGPRRTILRYILEVLAFWDTDDGQLVFGGTLEGDTHYSDRAIRRALGELVQMGWLTPDKPAGDHLESRNQHGRAAAPRVHGHLGGCRPGGEGEKTRYRINYLPAPADEAPPARRVKTDTRGNGGPHKGERGAAKKDTLDPQKGERGAEKGERGAEQGGTAFPRSNIETNIEPVSGGRCPPLPPGCGEPDPYQGSEPPQQGICTPATRAQGPFAPKTCPEDEKATERTLEREWGRVVGAVRSSLQNDPGVRLWIDTPKVRPLSIVAGVLHLAVASTFYADQVANRYASALLAAVTDQVAPVQSLTCHIHKECAA